MTPNEIKELEIQEDIIKHVDAFRSFRFNAGAGAGKTYALIEMLKHVIVNKISAARSSQKVVCITYTNVAVNEIKRRLGNSDAVHVSTIHERLWELVKRAQPQLLICHKEKIEDAIEKNSQDLFGSDKAMFFIKLDEPQRNEFIEFAKRTKELFYQYEKQSAASFKGAYSNTEINPPEFLTDCLKNVDKFKYVIKLLYKNQRLKDCLDRINAGEEKRVSYDNKVNVDRLHRMKFSHDTLLEYALKLVESYPTLCRIVVDSYPYFFIDEYQDAHSNVVKFVKTINDYALENNKKWMVGYFGDTAQSIYEDGIGRKIEDLHGGLVSVNKLINRRSHRQLIDVANNIRADEIVQVPIFEGRNAGSVHFFYNDSDQKLTVAEQFLAEYKNDLASDNGEPGNIGDEEIKINCLVLTNKLMATFNGFGDVYEVFQKSAIYHDNLNTQVLSQQLEKLHPVILTIYRLVKLYQDIQESVVSYYDVFGASSENMAFSKASLVVRELKNGGGVLFKDWLDLIICLLESGGAKAELCEALINCVNFERDEVASAGTFESKLLGNINFLMNEESEDEVKAKEKVDNILALPLSSLMNWANFIDGKEAGDIVYHTYHGTKGEEYENVAIILEHSFGLKNKNKFKKYFEFVQKSTEEKEQFLTDPEAVDKLINTQNLLYVACSRAIKNLRVLYLDEISEIASGINTVFGESRFWPIE